MSDGGVVGALKPGGVARPSWKPKKKRGQKL